MKLAIVGISGLVGTTILKVLEERALDISQIIGIASKKSVGQNFIFKGKNQKIVSIEEGLDQNPSIAIFSAGSDVSLLWAPRFSQRGCYVVDNSSAWRMDPKVALVVPEINAKSIEKNGFIIANPNCSTIQLVLTLAPLHNKFEIDRLVISTYQSFTGTGAIAVQQYNSERAGNLKIEKRAYPHPIFENCIPQCDVFMENAYTKEEMKLVYETRKILGDEKIRITATAVRVPVLGGHSESVNIQFKKEYRIEEIYKLLEEAKGIEVIDDPANGKYPMPLHARNNDSVFVGRIRRDHSIENGLNIWIVSDNLRKGAATNAVQIVQYLNNCKQGLQ